jgi:hypothetical protein
MKASFVADSARYKALSVVVPQCWQAAQQAYDTLDFEAAMESAPHGAQWNDYLGSSAIRFSAATALVTIAALLLMRSFL